MQQIKAKAAAEAAEKQAALNKAEAWEETPFIAKCLKCFTPPP